MGEEIQEERFSAADFRRFNDTLRAETESLRAAFAAGLFVDAEPTAGFELESWLVDEEWSPAPRNEEFLARLRDELVVPELARFNVELNTTPQPLVGEVLGRVEESLRRSWSHAQAVAATMGMRLIMVGILPTVAHAELCTENMSDRARFRALNEQILRMRNNVPLMLDIRGRQHLQLKHRDVMLESAATSLQIHLQVGEGVAADYYDAAQAASAAMVAASGNSPFLFGRDLWAETRIPLFEQAVNTNPAATGASRFPARVSFGDGYLAGSLMELFEQNLERFPALLPVISDSEPSTFHHLRLHNGTIWRWNRPLIGITRGGPPHLRIEHRVVPAGPSIVDIVVNAAFFFGLVHGLVQGQADFRDRLAFPVARENFYRAAREGLGASMQWLDGRCVAARELLLEHLLPLAEQGLADLGLESGQAQHYLNIMAARIERGRTGSEWQRAFVARHGSDMRQLTAAYWDNQEAGRPVSEWGL